VLPAKVSSAVTSSFLANLGVFHRAFQDFSPRNFAKSHPSSVRQTTGTTGLSERTASFLIAETRRRKMLVKSSSIVGATALTIIASLVLLVVAPESHADNACRPDQKQLQSPGLVLLGGQVVLAQSFIPSAPGHRVCRVKVFITRNAAAAGDLTLHVLRSNFTDLDAAVTIPAGAIPMGNSIQLFDFGCNGAVLAGMPFYSLKLESPGSQPGAYAWRGMGGNPYDKPGNAGRGWRNLKGGNGPWTNLGGWDYAFEIYMCD
jgi:hypothetical protein